MPTPRAAAGSAPRAPRLLGREREAGALQRAIGQGLVAVTGPPGVGKSALIAAALAGRRDVGWFDLTGARGAPDLWAALGRTLATTLVRPEDAAPVVARALRNRGVAVAVLDPAELLSPDAWAAIDALRAEAPDLCLVVATVVAPPLADAALLPLGPLPQADAVSLLLRLAAARAVDAPPDDQDPAWAGLAARLDGLPLALELAAARLPLLTPAELLARVDDARLLAGGRHASAEGALRYAWALLGPQEQGDLAALSSLRGGFTLDAAEAALGAGALDRLDALRARSAVIVRRGRFQVLEGLRRIAREEAPAVADAAARRLVAWWAARADTLRSWLRGPRGDDASRLLAVEQPNLLAAWQRARGTDPPAAARIGAAMLASMHSAGPAWGLDGLDGLEGIGRSVGGALGAEVLNRIAALHLLLQRREEARPLLVEALSLAEEARDPDAVAYTLCNLGLLHQLCGEHDLARAALVRAAAVAPDDALAALAFTRLGAVEVRTGDTDAAAEALEEARVRIARGAFPRLAGTAHLNLAITRADQGRLVEAEELIARAIEETAVHDEGAHAFAQFNAALLALARGDHARATPLAEAAVAALDALGSDLFRGYARIPLALARWCAGDRPAARDLLVLASRLCEGLDPQSTALARAWRAALDAASGHPEALPEALAAARALNADPHLLDALAAFDGHTPLGPAPARPTLYTHVARRLARPEAPALRVARDGRWFERCDQRVDLARRGSLHRILAALATARVEHPGQGLGVDEVFAAGWPGEKALPDAAAGRVYTAVRELRAQGLGELLQRHADGYLLDAEARVEVEG